MLVCLFCFTLTLGSGNPSVVASAQQAAQLSVGYLHQDSRPAFGGGRFGMNGGRADLLLPVTRRLGLVCEFSGVHTGSVPLSGSGLTLATYMAGPRLWLPIHRQETGRIVPFAQVLMGGVHGSQGAFPNNPSLYSTGNAFALAAGAGLQVSLNRRVSLRAIQTEYLYSRLPNSLDNYQNSVRIGAGMVLRLR
jgi:opacity protein-like surface antigen